MPDGVRQCTASGFPLRTRRCGRRRVQSACPGIVPFNSGFILNLRVGLIRPVPIIRTMRGEAPGSSWRVFLVFAAGAEPLMVRLSFQRSLARLTQPGVNEKPTAARCVFGCEEE